jgi:diguanylate cyclase (GGDEF)-like protein/PAS domain S-box-containing protein
MFWDHPHAVALLDLEGRIVCNNPAFRRLVGSISDAIAGNLFLALFPPFEADRVKGYLAASLRFETQPDLATRITLPEGTSVNVVLTLIPAQACGHAGLFVVVREVTGLLSAERAIAQIEREKGRLASLHAAILDSMPVHVALLDAKGCIIAVNEAWRRFGRQNGLTHPSACVGKNYLTVCNESVGSYEEASEVAAGLTAVLKGARPAFSKDYSCHSASERRWFRVHINAVDAPFADGAVVTHVNITEKQLAAEQTRLVANALRQLSEGVLVTDRSLHTTSINHAFAAMMGHSAALAAGMSLDRYFAASHRIRYVQRIRAALDRKRSWKGKLICRRGDGSEFPAFVTVEAVSGESIDDTQFVAVIRDLSAEQDYQRRLTHISRHDTLTGLPNRAALAEHTDRAISDSEGQQGVCAIILVSLDHFRLINESLGHVWGDLLLLEMARHLRQIVPPGALIGRVGSDEFAIILSAIGAAADARAHAQKIFEQVRLPVSVRLPVNQEGCLLTLTASVSVSTYPLDGGDFEEMLRKASIAMREAKRAGGNTVRVYARHMSIGDLNRLTLQSELSTAVQRNELILHYQPVVDLRTGSVRSIEALVRWQHRTLGLLAPGKFIGLAEQNGTIIEIGDWVLRTACADAVRLRQAALAPISVAVNLSARQFELKDLAKRVGCILEAATLDSQSLRLELTETMVMSNPDESRAILGELSAMGISLALDDFGTGYSSLGYLQQFPLHCLKIDRSFVSGVPGNERSEAITRAVVVLGKALHMRVVAEGVENHAQLDFLRNLGCDEVQGYLVSTPLPYDQLVRWLADRTPINNGENPLGAKVLPMCPE